MVLEVFLTQSSCWAVRLQTTGKCKIFPPSPVSPKNNIIVYPKYQGLALEWNPKEPECGGMTIGELEGYDIEIHDADNNGILHKEFVRDGRTYKYTIEDKKLSFIHYTPTYFNRLINCYWKIRTKSNWYSDWSEPAYFIIDNQFETKNEKLTSEANHIAEPKLCDLAVTDIYCSFGKIAFTVENKGEGIWTKPMGGKFSEGSSIMVKIWFPNPPGGEHNISLDSLRKINEIRGGMQTPGGATSFITSIEIPFETVVWITIDSTNRTRESIENNNTMGRFLAPCKISEHPDRDAESR